MFKFARPLGRALPVIALLLAAVFAAQGCASTMTEPVGAGETDPPVYSADTAAVTDVSAVTLPPAESGTEPAGTSEASSPETEPASDTVADTDPVGSTIAVSPTANPVGTLPDQVVMPFSVLRSAASEEDIFASENSGETVGISESKIRSALAENGFVYSSTAVSDVFSTVKKAAASGDAGFDLIVFPCAKYGALLLGEGLLQDLSLPGIGLDSDSHYVNRKVTSSLEYNGRTYFLSFDAFTSDLASTLLLALGVDFDGAREALSAAADGNGSLTLESFYGILSEAEDPSGYLVEADALAVYEAFGGRIVSGDNSGGAGVVPVLFETASLAAFDLANGFLRNTDGSDTAAAIFLYAADADDYSVKLPVPAVDASSGYRCPVSLKTVNAVAVPSGILRGSHLSQALSVIGKCTEGLRSDAVNRYFGTDSYNGGAGVADVILASQTAEAGELFTWGDLASMVGSLVSSSSVTSAGLSGESRLQRAVKAFLSAEAIVFNKLQ